MKKLLVLCLLFTSCSIRNLDGTKYKRSITKQERHIITAVAIFGCYVYVSTDGFKEWDTKAFKK